MINNAVTIVAPFEMGQSYLGLSGSRRARRAHEARAAVSVGVAARTLMSDATGAEESRQSVWLDEMSSK